MTIRPAQTAVGWLLAIAIWAAVPADCAGQSSADAPPLDDRFSRFFQLAGGAIAGLAIHESGHLFFDVLFDADPGIARVDLGGIPFFAIEHTAALSPRREFVVSSAGFWMQHLTSEWLLTARPGLRHQRGPVAKGLLAFNLLTSVGYASAAFARGGPAERDTRGMADSIAMDERWIGAMILAPAILDAWRYIRPDAIWAKWGSRAAKIVLVGLVVKSSR